ncbi:MAG: hypothetical protein N4A61_07450 [Pelagimonas sp.]|jgi:hypothetical protein|nr:hypothetical protein [Pelagimonas sp.]
MRRIFAFGLGLLTLTACHPTANLGEAVPFRQLLAETRDAPYECWKYDAASRTCEGIGRHRMRGNVIVSDLEYAAVLRGRTVRVDVSTRGIIHEGMACMDAESAEFNVRGALNRKEREVLEGLFSLIIVAMGDVCGSYYRREAGGYHTWGRSADGKKQAKETGIALFFAKKPKLRAVNAPPQGG